MLPATTMKKDTSSVPFSSYQKFVIFILALSQFSVILDFMIMSPLGDMLMKSMKLTTDQFGLCVAAYAISAGISGLLTAGFADRFDRKKLLVFFFMGFIVGTGFCALANSYVTLVAARVFTGIFGGVIGSISLAIITDIFDMHHRGRVMGFIQMGFGASQVLGIPISLRLANVWGWQAPFVLVVGIGIIAVLLIMAKLQPITTHLSAATRNRNVVQHLWQTATKRHHRIAFLATCILSLGGFMMMPFGSAFAINNLGVTETQLPNLFMYVGIGTLIIMPIVGKLSDKIDKFVLFAIASLWMLVMVVIYTNQGLSPLWMVVGLNVLMMMGVMSRMIPATALVTAIPELADRGAFMSINSSLQQIAGGFAAAFAGTIVVQPEHAPLQHYDTLGYIVCAISLLGILMVYRISVVAKNKMKEQKL